MQNSCGDYEERSTLVRHVFVPPSLQTNCACVTEQKPSYVSLPTSSGSVQRCEVIFFNTFFAQYWQKKNKTSLGMREIAGPTPFHFGEGSLSITRSYILQINFLVLKNELFWLFPLFVSHLFNPPRRQHSQKTCTAIDATPLSSNISLLRFVPFLHLEIFD